MTILFRTCASNKIGLGHLMRSRALASSAQKFGVPSILMGDLDDIITDSDKQLFDFYISCKPAVSKPNDAESLSNVFMEVGAKFLVLDDYISNLEYQKVLRNQKIPWLQFDYACDKPVISNLLVNANPVVQAKDYSRIIDKKITKLLLGPDYAVLRPQFQKILPRNYPRAVKRIVVMFGGGDDRGALKLTLDALSQFPIEEIFITLIIGPTNPFAHASNYIFDSYPSLRIKILIDPPNLAEAFLSSDLAVLSAGTSTYEAAACSTPMLLIALADNQLAQSRAWETLGLAKNAGELRSLTALKLSQKLIEAFSWIQSNSLVNTKRIVDAQGADRIISLIFSMIKT